ncbi:MAG: cyclic nucleotide-binding domain-containing protein [bacterium]
MYEIDQLDHKKMIEIINRLDFFNNFSIQEKQRIIAFHAQFFVYKQGEYLIREKGEDASIFILLSGTVNVTKGDSQFPLARLEAGEFFGEMSFLTNAPRTTSVIASEESIVIKIDKSMMDNLNVHIREKIKDKIIEKLVNRLDKMNHAMMNR